MEISELSDCLQKVIETYGKKFQIETTPDWYMMKIQEEAGELTSSYLQMTGRARQKNKTPEEIRKNFEDEISDVLAMTLLLARTQNVDIEKAFEKKWFSLL